MKCAGAGVWLSILGMWSCQEQVQQQPPLQAQAPAQALELEIERLRGENAQLQAELARAQAERAERERHWLEYAQGLSKLAEGAGASLPQFGSADALPPVVESAPAAPDPALLERAARDAQILKRMRALFIADQIGGLDALELGTLQAGFTGPVVFRALDFDGRPMGSICAERLYLEGSKAARTLTLVFEAGYQRQGGERVAFPESGALRIELPEVDPLPWMQDLPELFGNAKPRAVLDDGLHDLTRLRVGMNLLLREDAQAGYWRLAALEGVVGGVLREVVLDGLDREGRLEKKLFADRLQIVERPQGLLLLLESGAQLRGNTKAPFLEGRYRIHLPRADAARWREAGLPVQMEAAAAPEEKALR